MNKEIFGVQMLLKLMVLEELKSQGQTTILVSDLEEHLSYFTAVHRIGIENDVIDLLIEKVISAKNREELIQSTRALDRVLLWGHYVIPQWHISSYRTLYWDIFDKPEIRPKYSLGTNTWWIDPEKEKNIRQTKKSLE